MKTSSLSPIPVLILFTVLVGFSPNAYADPSGGGPTAVSVAKNIHAAAQVATLAEEFNQVMAEYETEGSDIIKKELFEKAKNILAELIQQANNVESEISIMAKKKLDKVYAEKLDRVLTNVLQIKSAAERKIRSAGQAI